MKFSCGHDFSENMDEFCSLCVRNTRAKLAAAEAKLKQVMEGNDDVLPVKCLLLEAENTRLRTALKMALDRWEYNLSPRDEPIFERAKAALAGEGNEK